MFSFNRDLVRSIRDLSFKTNLRSPARSTVELLKRRNGEGGIRTLGAIARTHDFQSCTLSRSATSPAGTDNGRRATDYGCATTVPVGPLRLRPHCPLANGYSYRIGSWRCVKELL